MSCFTANKIDFSKNSDMIQAFFESMNHFRLIMPEQVENWQSDENDCSFFIKNLGMLGMKKGDFDLPNRYSFISNHFSKVAFVLTFRLESVDDEPIHGFFEICAEMNPLVEMMAKRPLTSFVNILTSNLGHYLDHN